MAPCERRTMIIMFETQQVRDPEQENLNYVLLFFFPSPSAFLYLLL